MSEPTVKDQLMSFVASQNGSIPELITECSNLRKQIAQLTKERDELKQKLDEENLNRIGCEYAMTELRRCCGLSMDKIDLREVKLHIDAIVKERDDLATKCAELRDLIEDECDHDGLCGDNDPAPECRKCHALSDQCGTGWLSPEKAGRLKEFAAHKPHCETFAFPAGSHPCSCGLKQALEAAQ